MPAKINIIVIVGPTASGKSDLAIRLAKKVRGEIISADSRQVYVGLDIGTGKVPRDRIKNKELRIKEFYSGGVRHHLLDVASPKRQFSVSRYKKLAEKAIRDIVKRGKVPIICGGTGLYIDTLLGKMPIPEVPPNWELRQKLEKKSTEELFAQLKKLDPSRAKTIDPSNPRRLIRALEIVLTTKKPVPPLAPRRYPLAPSYTVLWLGINPGKEILAKRIEKRLDQRLKQGMIKEVSKLHQSGVSCERLESFGLEYRWVAQYLQKKIPPTEMRGGLLRNIVRYSKRQMTWFKRNPEIQWISAKGGSAGKNQNEALRLAGKFIRTGSADLSE